MFQQKQIEKYNGDLRKISAATAVYQTYQSNNAIFNAIEAIAPKVKNAPDDVRKFQVYNYELGLADMEKVLTAGEKEGLPEARAGLNEIERNINASLEATQQRLEFLQAKLDEKEKMLKEAADRSAKIYFWAYICFSAISITGALFRIAAK